MSGAIYYRTVLNSAYDYYSNISASNCNEGMNLEGASFSLVTNYSGFKVNYHFTSGFQTVQNFKLLNSTMDFGISGIAMSLQFSVRGDVVTQVLHVRSGTGD